MPIMYDRSEIEKQKAWFEHHYGDKQKSENGEAAEAAERITYYFRMFILSLLLIAIIIWISK